MQINLNTATYKPEFGALHIANAGKLKLYKMTDTADYKYLKTLPEKIDMGELMPNLDKESYNRWHEMLEYAVDNAQYECNETYLLACDNKPCGILTWRPEKNSKLDCICTWPVEFGKKVKLAGQTLFYQMYKDFLELKGKKIELEAITNGPYDTITKYEHLGFKKTSKVYPTKTIMEANADKIKEIFKKLIKIIDYETIEPEKVHLTKEFD